MQTFDAFKRDRYFERLDGLRAISIALVLTWHSTVAGISVLNGHTGVTLFFVISGFLITTLLLREADRNGKVSLASFYIRRVFRLLPLYYVALAVTSLAVVLGFGDKGSDFWGRMVYFLTYTNEFADAGTFGHSWSLAIEEKFYFVWPALAFAVPLIARYRGVVAAGLLALTTGVGLLAPEWYAGIYAPILAGCVLAIVMHKPWGFAAASRGASAPAGLALTAVAGASIAFAPYGHTQVLVGLAVVLAFPFFLVGNSRLVGWLSHPWLRWVGERAYAIYLFHPLVGKALQEFIPVERGPAFQWVHLLLMFALSAILAQALKKMVEDPLREAGRRIAARRTQRITAEPSELGAT